MNSSFALRFFIAGADGETRATYEESCAALRQFFPGVVIADFPAVGGRDVFVWIPAIYQAAYVATLVYLFLPRAFASK
jgi:hypothetical protein